MSVCKVIKCLQRNLIDLFSKKPSKEYLDCIRFNDIIKKIGGINLIYKEDIKVAEIIVKYIKDPFFKFHVFKKLHEIYLKAKEIFQKDLKESKRKLEIYEEKLKNLNKKKKSNRTELNKDPLPTDKKEDIIKKFKLLNKNYNNIWKSISDTEKKKNFLSLHIDLREEDLKEDYIEKEDSYLKKMYDLLFSEDKSITINDRQQMYLIFFIQLKKSLKKVLDKLQKINQENIQKKLSLQKRLTYLKENLLYPVKKELEDLLITEDPLKELMNCYKLIEEVEKVKDLPLKNFERLFEKAKKEPIFKKKISLFLSSAKTISLISKLEEDISTILEKDLSTMDKKLIEVIQELIKFPEDSEETEFNKTFVNKIFDIADDISKKIINNDSQITAYRIINGKKNFIKLELKADKYFSNYLKEVNLSFPTLKNSPYKKDRRQ